MENGILSDIMSFFSKHIKEYNMISLYEIAKYIDELKKSYEKDNQILIKKMNKKLSKNLNFFNYEIKKINLNENIELVINRELKTIKVLISSEGNIITDIKNKDIFKNLITDELSLLVKSLNEFKNSLELDIKTKIDNLNVCITDKFIEIFMFKSKNWITMGKAFSLKYDYFKSDYVYEIDAINLEKNIKNKEDELFNNIGIKKNILPNEFQLKYELYFNKKLEEKDSNKFVAFVNKVRKLMKK